MAKDHNPSVQDEEQYKKLGQEGTSKEKAARIANTPRHKEGKRGGKAATYGEWTKSELYDQAKQVGIEGRSRMDKGELIEAWRNH